MALTVKQWKTDNSVYGKAAVSKNNTGGSVFAFINGTFGLLFKYGTPGVTYGMASTRAVLMSDGITYYLITLKTSYKKGTVTYSYAYVSNQDFYFSAVRAQDDAKAKNDAQVLLNNLLASDKKLLLAMNTANNLIKELQARGQFDVTLQKKKLEEIAAAYTSRQEALKTNPAIKIVDYFKLSGIGCNCQAIGVIPIIVWGIAAGAGTVLAGLAVYYFLKPEYDTSQLHSQYLIDNEKELRAKLGPEVFEAMKKAIDGEIQENASTAYDEAKSETTFGMIKNVALMAAGFFLITKIQSSGKS